MRAAMIARWHYCISVEMVTGCAHWIVNVSIRTLDCKKKTSTYPSRRERPLIRKTGWDTTEREESRTAIERKREGGCSVL